MAQRKRPTTQSAISLTHPNAAGIDIGSAAHFVAVPPDRDDQPVREFASFTADLHRLADWLDACNVDTVAMESTGVYWIPLYELLQSRGFTVLLVNARHVKNVSGRKSDVLDCQWLQQLMSFGLLRGAFRPADQVCVLRSLSRQRAMLLRNQGRFVQHMQKALTQMNIQLANVISDVVGETGQKILRAIVDGERDGQALAKLRNARIQASEDEIAKSLQGNWRVEHLFALKQALDAFDFCATQLAECDTQIQAQLQALHVREDEPAQGKKRGRARNAPKFDLRTQLFQMCGVDLTRIDGIDVTTALVVVSEVGVDMSKFPSCVLPAHVRAHGQTQGRDGHCPQAGPADLRHADPRAGIHRPGAGLLRGALPPARLAQPRPEGQGHGHVARSLPLRQHRLNTPWKSISYLVFLEGEISEFLEHLKHAQVFQRLFKIF